MKIGLNLLPVVPGIGGAWHYIANLLSALAEYDRANEYVALVTSASAALVPKRSNFMSIELQIHARWRPLRIAFENSVLPVVTRKYQLDCMHHFFGTLPFFGSEPSVVSVFDLMVFVRPADFSYTKRAYLQWMRRRAASEATVLAPMSQSTADSLSDLLGVPKHRMSIVPTAIGPAFHRREARDVQSFRERFQLDETFWLCVADAQPHKNLLRLVEAFAQLRAASPGGWPLVIRGGCSDDVARLVAARSMERHVRILPWLNDDEMPLLYSAAGALVFPSLFEGGGLPVMEAMCCGCPVVASDLPTTREFALDAALTFDPRSVTDMARAMRECECMPATRERLATSGRLLATQFNPASVAAACLEAYRRAVNAEHVAS
ncbi:MAG: glycosyltransferase family 1 protein [bacterium]